MGKVPCKPEGSLKQTTRHPHTENLSGEKI